MMTLQEWIDSGCKLENRLHIGKEIDDEMARQLTGYFPSPDPDMIQILRRQAGSAYDVDGSRKSTYNTFHRVDGKWRYVGRCFIDETENRHHIYLFFTVTSGRNGSVCASSPLPQIRWCLRHIEIPCEIRGYGIWHRRLRPGYTGF